MYIEYEKQNYDAIKINKDFKLPELIQNYGYEAAFKGNILNILFEGDIVEQGEMNDYFIYDFMKDSEGEEYYAFTILPYSELNKSFYIK